MQIQISWHLQKPTYLIYTVCKGRVYQVSAGQGLSFFNTSGLKLKKKVNKHWYNRSNKQDKYSVFVNKNPSLHCDVKTCGSYVFFIIQNGVLYKLNLVVAFLRGSKGFID